MGGAAAGSVPAGHLFGLTLANNATDVTNDIDIAIGVCASEDTEPVKMVLASALTKRLDASWTVGSGSGGLDTGSIANRTYHVWLIRRPDTGVVDALFSASASAPTMPANYTQKRRIGSIVRLSGSIRGFLQDGDVFNYAVAVTDRASTSAQAATTLTMTVPTGINVRPIFSQQQVQNTAGAAVTSFANGSSAFAEQQELCVTKATTEKSNADIFGHFQTNTLAQLRYEVVISSGTLASNVTQTRGWIDTRGRF
jgi:hypothetical protein